MNDICYYFSSFLQKMSYYVYYFVFCFLFETTPNHRVTFKSVDKDLSLSFFLTALCDRKLWYVFSLHDENNTIIYSTSFFHFSFLCFKTRAFVVCLVIEILQMNWVLPQLSSGVQVFSFLDPIPSASFHQSQWHFAF